MDSQIISMSKSFILVQFFCGYHEYQHQWTPSIGEVLVVKQEQNNCHDKHVVDIIKDGCTVGHVPNNIFKNGI